MKDLIFRIYALFFNFGARLKVKSDRVGLVSMHNAHFADGLGEVEARLGSYKIMKVERTSLESPLGALRFITLDAFRLGRAKYIFLNDNFMALAYAKPNRETRIVQLWHGMGAFKKFGFDIEVEPKVRRREAAQAERLTHVACSSVGVKEIYAGAFGVSPDKVYPVGAPNGDFYFSAENRKIAKDTLLELFPELEDKYIVLYAPTFREDTANDEDILKHFNAERIKRAVNANLGPDKPKDIEILVRLHPQVHESAQVKNAFDVTDYPFVNELCAVSDMLITDYSSICMDFALMKKPIVFYAYDLDYYKGARDFYFDYETYVPGPVAKTEDELIFAIKDARKAPSPKLPEFRKFNFDEPDGRATERLLEIVM